MLANTQVRRRDLVLDGRAKRAEELKSLIPRQHFHQCKIEIERCVQRGLPIQVRSVLVTHPVVVDALRLIGFTLGRPEEGKHPAPHMRCTVQLTNLIPN